VPLILTRAENFKDQSLIEMKIRLDAQFRGCQVFRQLLGSAPESHFIAAFESDLFINATDILQDARTDCADCFTVDLICLHDMQTD
jgi:hypothetical protein